MEGRNDFKLHPKVMPPTLPSQPHQTPPRDTRRWPLLRKEAAVSAPSSAKRSLIPRQRQGSAVISSFLGRDAAECLNSLEESVRRAGRRSEERPALPDPRALLLP